MKAFFAILCCFGASLFGQPRTVSELSVRGELMERSGIRIEQGNAILSEKRTGATHSASTDRAGRFSFFRLAAGDYELRFDKSGFKSLTVPLTLKDRSLWFDIALDSDPAKEVSNPRPTVTVGTNRELDSCEVARHHGRRIEDRFDVTEIFVPRKALTTIREFDYVQYIVHFPRGEKQDALNFMFGMRVGDAGFFKPPAQAVWDRRHWTCAGDGNWDTRLTAPDGRRSRTIQLLFGFGTYENVSPEAAAYFDKILDSMCCGKGMP